MSCLDCKTNNMPIDTVLTMKQWDMICPEGGELCASCIVKRASKLPHVMSLTCRITFASDYNDIAGGKYFAFMKDLDNS
jgi:hypothetical protein